MCLLNVLKINSKINSINIFEAKIDATLQSVYVKNKFEKILQTSMIIYFVTKELEFSIFDVNITTSIVHDNFFIVYEFKLFKSTIFFRFIYFVTFFNSHTRR